MKTLTTPNIPINQNAQKAFRAKTLYQAFIKQGNKVELLVAGPKCNTAIELKLERHDALP